MKPTAELIWSRVTWPGPGVTNVPWELTEVHATGKGAALDVGEGWLGSEEPPADADGDAGTDTYVEPIGVPLP
ncbi:hypothetical protein [Actinocrinis sp.]|uniref:hypothetical protein n=1 Tax=Actinocrinis sp. TaxID=1920516 RepID=UPI002D34BF1F|nr:hypothetical protein [Actinocrinis sp.]HZP51660.1 hypothetical protein [Actinocrinis sp.]